MSKKIITDIELLKRQYNAGESASELAERYKTSTGVITGTLGRAGVKLRSVSDSARLRIEKHGFTPINFTEEVRAKMRRNHADVSGEKNPNCKRKGIKSSDGVWLAPDRSGYLRRWCPDHPLSNRGYIGEHVYQACLKCGTAAVTGMDVHHIDGNNQNNSWDNLQVCTREEHMRIENNIRKGATLNAPSQT